MLWVTSTSSRALVRTADLDETRIQTVPGAVRFPSLASWVHLDIKGWTLADRLDDAQFERLQERAPAALGRFAAEDGSIEFASPAHLVTARRIAR